MKAERNPYNIIQAPVLTEKSLKIARLFNQYTFRVRADASKTEIKQSVAKIFNVDVEHVNIIKVRGKEKGIRFGRYRRGRTPSWKKAIVKVKSGQKIPIYEGL